MRADYAALDRTWLRLVVGALALLAFSAACTVYALAGEPPRASLAYRDRLIREARFTMGLGAPVPLFAAQIGQESGWRPDVCSPFACGLTQFTPATARWIAGLDPRLAGADVFDPGWAIRALVAYDARLHGQVGAAATDCDRWAMALSAYNGGLGWVFRDRRFCAARGGCEGVRWFYNVETANAGRSAAAWRENRGYPRRILFNQAPYADWGQIVACRLVMPAPRPGGHNASR